MQKLPGFTYHIQTENNGYSLEYQNQTVKAQE